MQERLDRLEADIDATRKRAEDADLLPDAEPTTTADGAGHPEWGGVAPPG